MKTLNHLSRIIPLLLLTSTLSACGQQAYRELENESDGSNFGGITDPGSNPGPTVTPTPTPTPTATLAQPITYDIQMKGTAAATLVDGSTIPAALTDNVFKVTATLGQGTNIPGTGFTAHYRCARWTVTVLGSSKTVLLSNTGTDITTGNGYSSYDPCLGAVASKTLDFSSRLTPGHGDVTVSVSASAYDNCRLYGNVYATGCPLTVPYSNHFVTGSIALHVNGTE